MESQEKQEKVSLPASLALIIWDELKEKYGIERRTAKNGLIDMTFTSEEIGLITKLKIQNPNRGNLQGISKLYNLQNLVISSDYTGEYAKSNNVCTITDKDMLEISKISSLKQLSISKQNDISYIGLEKLKKLEYLNIVDNPQLEELTGIDELQNLFGLTCYGNRTLMSIKGLSQCIKQNPELCGLDLDVLLFPESIDFNTKDGKYDEEVYKKIKEIDPKWHESMPYLQRTSAKRDSIQITTVQMESMHNKACKILYENVQEHGEIRDTVIGVERYLAQNVEYDYDSIKNKNGLRMSTDNNGIAYGPIGGTNGAYNAIMHNKCVCEGYTRAMQYLLKLKGINSRNVRCIGKPDELNMANSKTETKYTSYKLPDDGYHSIICVEDYNLLYCDPCWDAGRYQHGDKSMPYTLLNKEEISKTHTLSFQERRAANEHINVPRNMITTSIERNDIFKNTRLSNVRQASKTIENEIYKGQIRKDDR